MRIARIALWTAALALGLLAVDTASAGAIAPAPPAPYVTCTSPVVTDGVVTTASARAERGTSTAGAAPGDTCRTTSADPPATATLADVAPVASEGIGDEVRSLPTTGSSTASLAVVALAAVLIAFGVPTAVGWRSRTRVAESTEER